MASLAVTVEARSEKHARPATGADPQLMGRGQGVQNAGVDEVRFAGIYREAWQHHFDAARADGIDRRMARFVAHELAAAETRDRLGIEPSRRGSRSGPTSRVVS
jgi:hypothetical protein